jgi:hypothetical protein
VDFGAERRRGGTGNPAASRQIDSGPIVVGRRQRLHLRDRVEPPQAGATGAVELAQRIQRGVLLFQGDHNHSVVGRLSAWHCGRRDPAVSIDYTARHVRGWYDRGGLGLRFLLGVWVRPHGVVSTSCAR